MWYIHLVLFRESLADMMVANTLTIWFDVHSLKKQPSRNNYKTGHYTQARHSTRQTQLQPHHPIQRYRSHVKIIFLSDPFNILHSSAGMSPSWTWTLSTRGTQKFPELLKKLFKIFVQFSDFSHLQSTAHVTGCRDLCAAPTVRNIV
jgi:hypothetical protein